jgi:hypothetical protein
MEIGQGQPSLPQVSVPAANELPSRVADQATPRAVSEVKEAEAESEQQKRGADEENIRENGRVDIRA